MVVDHHCNGVGVHAFVAVNCRAEVARAAHSDTPRRLPGTSSLRARQDRDVTKRQTKAHLKLR